MIEVAEKKSLLSSSTQKKEMGAKGKEVPRTKEGEKKGRRRSGEAEKRGKKQQRQASPSKSPPAVAFKKKEAFRQKTVPLPKRREASNTRRQSVLFRREKG